MKKNIRTLAATLMTAALLAACTDDFVERGQQPTTPTYFYCTAVDGHASTTTPDGLMSLLMDYVDKGIAVTVWGNGSDSWQKQSVKANETIVFTTRSRDEAMQWAADMVDRGYTVTIAKDLDTGVYTCTATR